MPLPPLKTFAQFNVRKFTKEKKAIREQQAATHQYIREDKVELSSTQAKLRQLKVKVSKGRFSKQSETNCMYVSLGTMHFCL